VVIDAITTYYQEINANIHRGVHTLSQLATDAYEASRTKIQNHINAQFAHEVLFTSGTTHGVNLVANGFASLLKAGDEVLIPDNAYAPNKSFAESELKQWGITHQVYDPLDVQDLVRKINAKTRLVWLEAAGSVTMEFPDLISMVRVCRERGVCCVLDNTWGAGLAFNAFDLTPGQGTLSVDLTIHALTKYPSGGGDVLMGSIITRDDALARTLKLSHMRMGTGVGANDVELLLRSLPTLTMRYEAQDKAARELAQWCLQQTPFVQVLHPALPDAPGHAHWQQLCVTSDNPKGLAAGIFSVVMDARYSREQVDHFCDALKLFKLGYSWGGPISLVVPYHMRHHRQLKALHLKSDSVVRFCIGLESVEDLKQDIAQALLQIG